MMDWMTTKSEVHMVPLFEHLMEPTTAVSVMMLSVCHSLDNMLTLTNSLHVAFSFT